MPERARAIIRQILREDPSTEVRYLDALAPETYYLREDGIARVLFLNPIHRTYVEELQAPR